MQPTTNMSSESRRNFVKKSLVASVLAAQPTILAGLVRAGGGGDETTTDPGTTADPWETTEVTTADPLQTTEAGTGTTFDPWETATTVPPTEETTEATTEASTDDYTSEACDHDYKLFGCTKSGSSCAGKKKCSKCGSIVYTLHQSGCTCITGATNENGPGCKWHW